MNRSQEGTGDYSPLPFVLSPRIGVPWSSEAGRAWKAVGRLRTSAYGAVKRAVVGGRYGGKKVAASDGLMDHHYE
ncbi:hypothetical protein [Oryza sativa Japonica Group]|uniref:Uncharacterized protein n=1 Tax=Oryza sativa subsp. japonica TaxID=39947 RepID=Q8LJK3_ORYSJ|nr:hypothetical protein [Oryza sativa Japonica Group]